MTMISMAIEDVTLLAIEMSHMEAPKTDLLGEDEPGAELPGKAIHDLCPNCGRLLLLALVALRGQSPYREGSGGVGFDEPAAAAPIDDLALVSHFRQQTGTNGYSPPGPRSSGASCIQMVAM